MRKLINRLLVLLMVCILLTGCAGNGASKESAVKQLEELFTTIDLMDATIADLQTEMEAGRVSSEELCQMYIDRIEAYDEKLHLNSIIAVNPAALDDARMLDEERKQGNLRGPLHGIPVVVKANLDVAGMSTSAGAIMLADMIADEDSFVVKQLKDAGAVILAQCNLSEFAYSAVNSRSTLGGTVHNAYDTRMTPAGSSGGTGVAVTSNFAAAGIGTDTGGSIRNPSSFSNLYGMRPSKGLVSIDGIFPNQAYRDTAGPMARTVEDMALMLEVIAGSDEKDDYTLEVDADKLLGDGYSESLSEDGLKGVRIAYLESSFYHFSDEYGFQQPDQKIQEMLSMCKSNLAKAGAEFVNLGEVLSSDLIESLIEGIEARTFEYDANRYLNEHGNTKYRTLKDMLDTISGTVNHINLTWLAAGQEEYAPSFEETEDPYVETADSYKRISAWQQVLDGREAVTKILEENDIDAVMYLSFFDVAGDETDPVVSTHNMSNYDIIFSPRLGLPEVNIPMGFSVRSEDYASEMPLGLCLFSGYGNEETLLNIAYAYEKQAGDIIRRMPENTPALKDEKLNEFLRDLIEKAYSVKDTKNKAAGKMEIMLHACEKAMDVDQKDPYAVYEAARDLAEAYDRVMEVLG